jgi:hypothetical protein
VAEAETQAGQAASGDWLYDLACVYALARAAAKERPALAERYGARAVELLRRAAGTGFFDDPAQRAHLKADPDLASVRGRADYRGFLGELPGEEKPGGK